MSSLPTIDLTPADPFVVGEKPVPWEHQFKDAAGGPLVFPGGAQAKLVLRERWSTVPVEKNATVSDPPNGKVSYNWDGTEFPTPGTYFGELWVGNGGSLKYASTLVRATVRQPVGAVPNI
jgi:hypothetical protein